MNDELILNVLYLLAAICITYKMAWIARMTAHIHGWQATGLKFAGALYAIVVIGKAGFRFADAADPATLVDVGRELCNCLFLFFAIAVLRIRTGHW